MNIVKYSRKAFLKDLRTLANRQIVLKNEVAINEQTQITVALLRKVHIKQGIRLEEADYNLISEHVRERIINSLIRYFNPLLTTKPTTYTYQTANIAAKQAAAELIDWRIHNGLSADRPVDGDDENGEKPTHAEAQGDKCRSVGSMLARMDLAYLRRFMTPTERLVFNARYYQDASDTELYVKLGWTESRWRWFLKRYERKFAQLADLANHHRRARR